MTGRFERGILIGAGGLVVGLLAVAVISPPSSEITLPDAQLNAPMLAKTADVANVARTAVPDGIIRIKAVGTAAESLSDRLEIRALDPGYKAITLHTAADLSKTFKRIGYDLDVIKAGGIAVPRLFLARLPPDMSAIRQIKERKAIFFKTVLPLILQVNDEIRADRRRLWDLHARAINGEYLPAVDRLWLIVLAERYKVKRGDVKELLKRVDIMPTSMALAQAAEESGWGTSRFSREGNAIFGQWTFSDAEGLVPLKRQAGQTHKVRAFRNLLDSVRSYARNLNTHRAYRKLRTMRQQMRRDGTAVRGRRLIETLTSYSERGVDYVKGLRAIMSDNNLDWLDAAKLSQLETAERPVI